ncbi:MAG TPA: thioredoxin family protein, partial [Gemmatimonadaceae bacterium]|nr:thioredoxin family protein [Gemmatimonadaceae bacterium]
AKALRGKVVLVDFWTYSCINCLRALPYVKAWDAKYRGQGLVVIGVHAPEFDFERDSGNVRKSLAKLGITYPVAMDNDMTLWNAFHNQYWPAHYFIDAKGRIRHHHFGEGNYDESEKVIRQLLMEAHQTSSMPGTDTAMRVSGTGALAAPDMNEVKSPETYVGYARSERLAGDQAIAQDEVHVYTAPHVADLNSWALGGSWRVMREYGENTAGHATITFRFHARDLHLVLGPATNGKRVKFHVTIDGHAPGADAGVDVDANGNGVVTDHRLYQLVRQHGAVGDRTFTVTFEMPGVRAYAFTFG